MSIDIEKNRMTFVNTNFPATNETKTRVHNNICIKLMFMVTIFVIYSLRRIFLWFDLQSRIRLKVMNPWSLGFKFLQGRSRLDIEWNRTKRSFMWWVVFGFGGGWIDMCVCACWFSTSLMKNTSVGVFGVCFSQRVFWFSPRFWTCFVCLQSSLLLKMSLVFISEQLSLSLESPIWIS